MRFGYWSVPTRSLTSPGRQCLRGALGLALLCLPLPASSLAKADRDSDVFNPESARDWETRGTWLRDPKRRYVLLRGVNIGPRSKLPPFIPVVPLLVNDLNQV